MSDQRKGDDIQKDSEVPEEAAELEQEAVEVSEEEDRRPARRKFSCGVIYDTSQPMSTLEEWLNENCKGIWRVTLEDVDEGLMKKSFKLLFELPRDKENFIRRFAKR